MWFLELSAHQKASRGRKTTSGRQMMIAFVIIACLLVASTPLSPTGPGKAAIWYSDDPDAPIFPINNSAGWAPIFMFRHGENISLWLPLNFSCHGERPIIPRLQLSIHWMQNNNTCNPYISLSNSTGVRLQGNADLIFEDDSYKRVDFRGNYVSLQLASDQLNNVSTPLSNLIKGSRGTNNHAYLYFVMITESTNGWLLHLDSYQSQPVHITNHIYSPYPIPSGEMP